MKIIRTRVITKRKNKKRKIVRMISLVTFAISCGMVFSCLFLYSFNIGSNEEFLFKIMICMAVSILFGIISGITFAVLNSGKDNDEYVEEIESQEKNDYV